MAWRESYGRGTGDTRVSSCCAVSQYIALCRIMSQYVALCRALRCAMSVRVSIWAAIRSSPTNRRHLDAYLGAALYRMSWWYARLSLSIRPRHVSMATGLLYTNAALIDLATVLSGSHRDHQQSDHRQRHQQTTSQQIPEPD